MSKVKATPFDVTKYMDDDAFVAEYIAAAFEGGDVAHIAKALGQVARARGMAETAQKAGLGRESLYKALSGERKPELETVLKVLHAFGLQLTTKAA